MDMSAVALAKVDGENKRFRLLTVTCREGGFFSSTNPGTKSKFKSKN
jgi:hypothetical protein